MTTTEHIRGHLLASLGYATAPRKLPPLDELRQTEWSTAFEQHMRNRLLMGAFRYRMFCEPENWRYDFVLGIAKKVRLYQESGNTEHLVDVANYALLEFVQPKHPDAHWRAEDDHSHCPRR